MTDVLVIIGGIVPDEDAVELKKQGVAAVYQPGASLGGNYPVHPVFSRAACLNASGPTQPRSRIGQKNLVMNEKLKIAVFVDYDNIEIGVKSATLQRELDISLVLDSLKERGDIVAKFAYADWASRRRQAADGRKRCANGAADPLPRGDKNGADINLALDALEMAFTHEHVNAFAIISGDSDFIPLVNKLKEYGKIIFVVGGRALTSTILQKNCHEFISFESLIDEPRQQPPRHQPPQSQPQQESPQAQLAEARPAEARPAQSQSERDNNSSRCMGGAVSGIAPHRSNCLRRCRWWNEHSRSSNGGGHSSARIVEIHDAPIGRRIQRKGVRRRVIH